MNEWEDVICKVLKRIGVEYSNFEVKSSAMYLKMIWEAINRVNLVGANTREELIEKHFLDSLALIKFYRPAAGTCCDLGSGGGFPGVPLKIFNWCSVMYLLEASRKKINNMKHIIKTLPNTDIYTLHGRAEMWGRDERYRENFDFIVSRAVADTPVMVELGLPLLINGGLMFLFKGPGIDKEEARAENALEVCGGEIHDRYYYRLSTGEERIILAVKKTGYTPSKFPRREGMPEKKPL